MLAPCGAG